MKIYLKDGKYTIRKEFGFVFDHITAGTEDCRGM